MADTVNGVPVYKDSAGVWRERPEQAEIDAIRQELDASERTFSEYGGGFVDYTDFDFVAGTVTQLQPGVPTQLVRDLGASSANEQLNRPFASHQFWDNSAKLIKARSLFDTLIMSAAVRLIPDQVGGVLRVALQAGPVEIGGKNMAITAPVGATEQIRVDFIFPTRGNLVSNGAKIMLTANVPMALVEFSPEFFPIGYKA